MLRPRLLGSLKSLQDSSVQAQIAEQLKQCAVCQKHGAVQLSLWCSHGALCDFVRESKVNSP